MRVRRLPVGLCLALLLAPLALWLAPVPAAPPASDVWPVPTPPASCCCCHPGHSLASCPMRAGAMDVRACGCGVRPAPAAWLPASSRALPLPALPTAVTRGALPGSASPRAPAMRAPLRLPSVSPPTPPPISA